MGPAWYQRSSRGLFPKESMGTRRGALARRSRGARGRGRAVASGGGRSGPSRASYGFFARFGLRPRCVWDLPRRVLPFLNFPRLDPPRVVVLRLAMVPPESLPTRRESLDPPPRRALRRPSAGWACRRLEP